MVASIWNLFQNASSSRTRTVIEHEAMKMQLFVSKCINKRYIVIQMECSKPLWLLTAYHMVT